MAQSIQALIDQFDSENLFSVLAESRVQAQNAWKREIPHIKTDAPIHNILFCGMGGSAISGNFAINFLKDELSVPIIVNRGYSIPRWAGRNTLVIASSYSGNTEETIAAFNEARARNCNIVCITNGGALGALVSEQKIPTFALETGLQPRYALYSSFFTLLKIMESLKIIPEQSSCVEKCISIMKESAEIYKQGGIAFDLATKLCGSITVVYSAEGVNDAVGMRLKAQLNENSKAIAFHATMSEANHNEIVGWEALSDSESEFSIVMLEDEAYNQRLRLQFDAAKRVMEGAGLVSHRIESKKHTHKERLIDLVYLSDWISYYAALISRKDPATIENINKVKEHLKKHPSA